MNCLLWPVNFKVAEVGARTSIVFKLIGAPPPAGEGTLRERRRGREILCSLACLCRALKQQTCNISAISPRGEVSMCYITFKTPTMQLTLGNGGSAFGSYSSSVEPTRTWSHFSLFNDVHSPDQQSIYPLCPKTTETSATARY